MARKKVLLVGWDAADWKVINPLLDSGQMPALAKLIGTGSMGHLATLDPPLSPILWTSIATGKTADKHGVLNFTEPNPETGDIQPVTVTSRKVKAVWNILHQEGYKTHLVGWWPSHPAEPINGVCVSNFFQRPVGIISEPWPLPPGAIHPKELRTVFEELRVHPGEITQAHLQPFVPLLKQVQQEEDQSLQTIATLLASAASVQAAATWILENREWDFMGVYFDTIDHFCHGFMKYHPPKMDGIPDQYFELYKGVISGAYIFMDMMLERLMKLAGDDATIVLLSDHGFHSDHLRPKRLPQEPASPALEHSPYGILCLSGPGIRKDERIYGATLLDITPTILNLFGLAIGEDMDGKILTQALEDESPAMRIPSWDEISGECGMHPKDQIQDAWAAHEAMQQLIELGYVEELSGDKQDRLQKTKTETEFYLARVLMHGGKHREAAAILETLYTNNEDAIRYGLRLAACYQALNDKVSFRRIIESLKDKDKEHLPQLDLMEATLLLAENKPREALHFLEKAFESSAHFPFLHIQTGNVYNAIHRWTDASASFTKAISLDPDNAGAHQGLGYSLLMLGDYENAAESLLTSIGLNYNVAEAHYFLGIALIRLEEFDAAVNAFRMALQLSPGLLSAKRWLLKIARTLPEELKSEMLNYELKKFETVTVITGLPGTGLEEIGALWHRKGRTVEAFSIDQLEENGNKVPNELIKRSLSARSPIIIPEQLLQSLTTDYNYKIVRLTAPHEEILSFEAKRRNIREGAFPSGLSDVIERQRQRTSAWISTRPEFQVLELSMKSLKEDDILSEIDKYSSSEFY
jgi:predicted AlkP superfamily phosphohydrolase/phosphomutase/tetratricopeptide (TPR) repeat protein